MSVLSASDDGPEPRRRDHGGRVRALLPQPPVHQRVHDGKWGRQTDRLEVLVPDAGYDTSPFTWPVTKTACTRLYERTISWGTTSPQPALYRSSSVGHIHHAVLNAHFDILHRWSFEFCFAISPSPSAKTFYLVCSLHNDALLQENFADRLRHPMRQYLWHGSLIKLFIFSIHCAVQVLITNYSSHCILLPPGPSSSLTHFDLLTEILHCDLSTTNPKCKRIWLPWLPPHSFKEKWVIVDFQFYPTWMSGLGFIKVNHPHYYRLLESYNSSNRY